LTQRCENATPAVDIQREGEKIKENVREGGGRNLSYDLIRENQNRVDVREVLSGEKIAIQIVLVGQKKVRVSDAAECWEKINQSSC